MNSSPRKPTQQKYVEAAITVASNLYLHTIPGANDAPARLQSGSDQIKRVRPERDPTHAHRPQRWNDGDSFHVILPDQKVNHKNFDAEFP